MPAGVGKIERYFTSTTITLTQTLPRSTTTQTAVVTLSHTVPDVDPTSSGDLSSKEIGAIVGSIAGFFFICLLWRCCIVTSRRNRQASASTASWSKSSPSPPNRPTGRRKEVFRSSSGPHIHRHSRVSAGWAGQPGPGGSSGPAAPTGPAGNFPIGLGIHTASSHYPPSRGHSTKISHAEAYELRRTSRPVTVVDAVKLSATTATTPGHESIKRTSHPPPPVAGPSRRPSGPPQKSHPSTYVEVEVEKKSDDDAGLAAEKLRVEIEEARAKLERANSEKTKKDSVESFELVDGNKSSDSFVSVSKEIPEDEEPVIVEREPETVDTEPSHAKDPDFGVSSHSEGAQMPEIINAPPSFEEEQDFDIPNDYGGGQGPDIVDGSPSFEEDQNFGIQNDYGEGQGPDIVDAHPSSSKSPFAGAQSHLEEDQGPTIVNVQPHYPDATIYEGDRDVPFDGPIIPPDEVSPPATTIRRPRRRAKHSALANFLLGRTRIIDVVHEVDKAKKSRRR